MSRNLYRANANWANRPADERYWDLDTMLSAAQKVDSNRQRVAIDPTKIRVEHYEDELVLKVGDKDHHFTNWGFQQITGKLGCPADYLRTLPTEYASQLLSYHFEKARETGTFAKNAQLMVRGDTYTPSVEACVSEVYGYIPNWKIIEGLVKLQDKGWAVPPGRPNAKTRAKDIRRVTPEQRKEWDRLKIGVGLPVGSPIGPSGLYMGDRNMFAFMVRGGDHVGIKGFDLQRGAFFENAETGGGTCRFTMFAYDYVCGNHIVWSAKDIHEISIRHIGKKAESKAIEAVHRDLDDWINNGTKQMVVTMEQAAKLELGKDKSEVLEKIYSNRRVRLPLSTLDASYDLAERLDGDRVSPRTLWGMVSGLTRYSQLDQYGDERVRIEQQIPSLLAMVN